jgi:hypothetical protein
MFYGQINIKHLLILLLFAIPLLAEGKKYKITAPAFEIDQRTKDYPEIRCVFSNKWKPTDNQLDIEDTSVSSRDR